MIANKKVFFTGFGMMIGFIVVLIVFFSPVFGGQNGLDYLDNLYNSISKGSAYYIPQVKQETEKLLGKEVNLNLVILGQLQPALTAALFEAGGAKTVVGENRLEVTGDLGKILDNCLADADAMYHNDGQKVSDKYDYDERAVLYNWWKALKEMEKALKKQKMFSEADKVALVMKKAVESSYNYYKIEPQKITAKLWIVLFSLIFYVIYTMWYGFSFMFMFEGWGMKLDH